MKNSYLSERFRELKNDFRKQINIADTWDRLAAFVLDLISLIFLTNLIFASLKKKLEVAVLNEHDGAAQIYFWLMIVGFAVLFIIYHTLSIFFFKKTLGKKVFSLEVRSAMGDSDLSLGNCILRALGQAFSICLIGFPFLQVFSHKMRRPIHDRMADTITCSLRKKGKTPDFIEKLWVKVIYITVVVNVVVLSIAALYFLKSDMSDITEFVTEPEYLCDDVSEAKEYWPASQKLTRLDIALTMFGAGEISKDCLEIEADKFLSFEQDLDKAYLAKAFAHEDNAEISNDYLKKVCEVNANSESCVLTKMISAWSAKKWSDVDKLLAKNDEVSSPFFAVWVVQHYDREQNYEHVLSLVEQLSPNRALESFIGKYKAIALWNLDRKNEAEQLFESTYANMTKDSQDSFMAEMCRLEADNNCQASQSKACEWLTNQMHNGDFEYQQTAMLSLMKAQKCGLTKIDDIISKYRNVVDDTRMQLYLAANKAEAKGKKSVAVQLYTNLLETTQGEPYFHYEVRSHLLDLATSKKDYQAAVVWWVGAETFNNYHFSMGKKILRSLMQQKMWDLALQVSQKISNESFLSPDLQKRLAIVFYKNNKMNLAKKMVQKVELAEHSKEDRGLASVDEYQEAREAVKHTSESP